MSSIIAYTGSFVH